MRSVLKMLREKAGLQQLADKVTGLYYKSEADKNQLQQLILQAKNENLYAAGQLLTQNLLQKKSTIQRIQEAEFKVFSQFGEDGIIQFLVQHVEGLIPTFIEFGVENYLEANTRFLLQHNNWSGLVIDGSEANIAQIQAEDIYWRYELTAVCQFITKENINSIFRNANFQGKIGMLSIDIDGNDYWVWEAISEVDAQLVIAEYNSNFGYERAISVPYDPSFYRTKAHHSNLYFGASLAALMHLAQQKGYALIGCTSAGNNAFFLKKELLGGLKEKSVAEAFVPGKSRESRDANGKLTFANFAERQKIIKGMPVINVLTGKEEAF